MFTNRNRCTAVKIQPAKVQLSFFFARELIQLFYVVFYLVRVVQNFFFGLLIKLIPKKWLGVENDWLNDENYVFVRPCAYVCPYCQPGEKGPLRRCQGPSCSRQSRTVLTTMVVGHVRHEQEVSYLTTLTIARLHRIGGR
jgi:hypothetical protein